MAAQLAATSLVGFGRVGEAVAEHDAAFRQRRLNDFRYVLGARGEHQGQLRQRRKTGGRRIQQKPADFFSGRGSARFTRYHHGQSLRAKYGSQLLHLRALAAAVEPFEGDEPAAMMIGRHAEMINERPVFGTCGYMPL